MAEFSDLLVSSEVKVGVLHLSWFHRHLQRIFNDRHHLVQGQEENILLQTLAQEGEASYISYSSFYHTF
jgi:hypothetical protein